ncbi:MAG: ABC transporter substrate-binding protein [Chloroflexi bacterium]|nr:ABC transporter substrate-binding protein [Chloroflexota bacterium]
MRLSMGLILLAFLVMSISCSPAVGPASNAPAGTAAQQAPKAADSGAQSQPKAAAKALTKVRVSHAGVGIFRLPLYVALLNGYFKDEGVDVEIVDTRSGSDAMKMLAGGAVEFSTGQLLDAVNLNKEGINIQGVALLTSRIANSIVLKKGLQGQIRSFKDLTGQNHTVGITSVGSGTWQLAVYTAQKDGVKKEDLNFISVGSGASVLAAVKAGKVDAMSYADPENFSLVSGGDAEFLIDLADPATHQKYIGDTYLNNQIMVKADYIKSNPAVVQGFVNGIQRALIWENQHTAEDIAKLLTGYSGFQGFDQKALIGSLKRQASGNPKSAVISKDAFDNAMKLPIAVGAVDQAMPFEKLVNTELAEKAVQKYPVK